MSFRFGKKTRTLIKLPAAFTIRWCALWVMLTLMPSPLLVATLRARTLLDPQPENSSTLFGSSTVDIADDCDDGAPDLAVGAPFQDGDFDGAPDAAPQWGTATLIETNGFKPPANLCKLAVNQNGDAMAVWQQGDSSGVSSIWANRFASANSALTPTALTFTDVSTAAGFFGLNSSWCAAWGDYDNDGNLDVMTLGHIQANTGSISQLWHSNGDGTFTDVTTQAGLNPNNGDAHGVVWGDFDSDGKLDLHISKGSTKYTIRITLTSYGIIMVMGPSLISPIPLA